MTTAARQRAEHDLDRLARELRVAIRDLATATNETAEQADTMTATQLAHLLRQGFGYRHKYAEVERLTAMLQRAAGYLLGLGEEHPEQGGETP